MLDAPTGSGKSAVAVAVARHYRGHIVTATRVLQDQYDTTPEFNSEYTIFGKTNYKCGLSGFTHLTVDQAICSSDLSTRDYAHDTPYGGVLAKTDNPSGVLRGICAGAGHCEYYKKIMDIPSKPGGVTNYDLFFNIKPNPLGTGPNVHFGKTIIFDEAHNLIDKLISVYSYSITEEFTIGLLGSAGSRTVNESVPEWLSRLLVVAQNKMVKSKSLEVVAQLRTFHQRLGSILKYNIADRSRFHIEEKDREVDIKPVDFSFLKGEAFYSLDRVLLLTATFQQNMLKMLGISEQEVVVISIPSTFNKARRPVFFVKDAAKLNYKSELKSLNTLGIINRILATHPDQKGILHCGNYKFFNQLKASLGKNQRFIWVDRGDNKAAVLKAHSLSKKPTILVSPSMMEGVDLKDDLARFQIMVKIPYPALDVYTRKLMERYDRYYETQVACKIMQAYGRPVRSEDDSAVMYIIDGSFERLLHKSDLMSNFFNEALHTVSEVQIGDGDEKGYV